MKILMVLTGSIALPKAVLALSALKKNGHTVRVAATESAMKFVSRELIEGIVGQPVLTSIWQQGEVMAHIDWVRWANVIAICPATANTINSLASGLSQDVAGAFFLSHQFDKPFLIFPAMNPAMWSHPVTQASVAKLIALKVKVVSPARGLVACGEEGDGRLLEPVEIVHHIESSLLNSNGLRVLITGGGTAEPIDSVRVITNTSTGETSRLLSEHMSQLGHKVTYLKARSATNPAHSSIQTKEFWTFSDLELLLRRELGTVHYDLVIHAAAVSDFSLADSASHSGPKQKLSSDQDTLQLTLKKNPKLISYLKAWSVNPNVRIVGFKLVDRFEQSSPHARTVILSSTAPVSVIVENAVETLPQYRIYRSTQTSTQSNLNLIIQSDDRAKLADHILNALDLKREATL